MLESANLTPYRCVRAEVVSIEHDERGNRTNPRLGLRVAIRDTSENDVTAGVSAVICLEDARAIAKLVEAWSLLGPYDSRAAVEIFTRPLLDERAFGG